MKDRQKKILQILSFTVLPILIIVMLLSFLGNKMFDKTYSLDDGMNNISAFVDEDDSPTSASFVLEYLDHESKENIGGSEVKVTSTDGTTLSFYDATTNEEIEVTGGIVTLSNKGTIVKVNGIQKGNTYSITLKP